MPSDFSLKAMNSIHRVLLRLSAGRLGWSIVGMPVIELTTTGRSTGTQRTVLLTSPIRDAGAYIVVASRGGDDQHPGWFLNIRKNPQVTVRVSGGAPQRMLAQVADTDTRARLWPLVTQKYPNYAAYQRRTTREIPLVLLRPVH